ncbi:MAG: manganese efflux pump, partial [Alloprevotella tannerae]|nr:manganese efflux pump [Alloprevotella tannerae]
MSYIDALLLGVALAMDCFTVSITCGIIERRLGWQVLVMALTFGFFQAGMALLGWVAGDLISPIVLTYNKW